MPPELIDAEQLGAEDLGLLSFFARCNHGRTEAYTLNIPMGSTPHRLGLGPPVRSTRVGHDERRTVMEQNIPMSLQVALYVAATGIVVIACVVIYFAAKLRKQLERVVSAVETFETELIPLARESRVAVTRFRDLSDRMQKFLGVVGDLVLPPMAAFNTTSRVVQTAATTFVQSLWNGRNRVRAGRSS